MDLGNCSLIFASNSAASVVRPRPLNFIEKFVVDIFTDGYVFSQQLPYDYVKKSREIVNLSNITLKDLSPVDIIITKAARFNARDEEDIETLSKYANKEELIKRFETVVKTFSGREEDYRYHFEVILKRFFNKE